MPQAVGVVGAAQRLDGAHVLLQAAGGYRGGGRAPLRPLPEDHWRRSSRCQGGHGGDGRGRRAGGAGGHPRPVRASGSTSSRTWRTISPVSTRRFLDSITNVLLIRDPTEMLPSLARQLPSPPCGTRACASRPDPRLDPGARRRTHRPRRPRATPRPARRTAPGLRRARHTFRETRCSPGRPARSPRTACGPGTGTTTSTPRPASRPTDPRKDQFPARLKPLLEECLPLYERLRGHAIGA